MTVAVVDTGTAAYVAAATTQDYTFTVSATATAAIFLINQDATQSITSVTWDQGNTNQACTLVGSISCPTASQGKSYIYALVNPTARAGGTLRIVSGTGTGTSCELQSYSGTNTASVAACFTNALTANGTAVANPTTAGTAAQSGVSGDMYVSTYVNAGTISSVNQTSIDATAGVLSPTGSDAGYNRAASAGSSITLSCQIAGGGAGWASVSCDITQAAAALSLNSAVAVQI